MVLALLQLLHRVTMQLYEPAQEHDLPFLLAVLGSLPIFPSFAFEVLISDLECSLLGLLSDKGLERELLFLASRSILWLCFGLGRCLNC